MALLSAIPADYLDRFWTRLVAEAGSLLRSGLGNRFGQHEAPELDAALLTPLAPVDAVPSGPPPEAPLTGDEHLDTSLKTGLGTAAAATAYAAWLGPAASSVTLGAALTGVGIPVALLGVGVSFVISSRRKRRSRQAEALADELVDELALGFEQAVIDGPLSEAVSTAIDTVSGPASTDGPLPFGRSASAWLAEVRDIRERLEQPAGWSRLPVVLGHAE